MGEMGEIANLIGTMGFPIYACIYQYKLNTELMKTISELNVTLKGIDVRLQHLESEMEKEKDNA